MDASPSPIDVLTRTIDRLLVSRGTDPHLVTLEDKILLAVQYVETGAQPGDNCCCQTRNRPNVL